MQRQMVRRDAVIAGCRTDGPKVAIASVTRNERSHVDVKSLRIGFVEIRALGAGPIGSDNDIVSRAGRRWRSSQQAGLYLADPGSAADCRPDARGCVAGREPRQR